MCEASGAVAFPEGSFGRAFVVGNDEDNVLRAYAADRDGEPLPPPDWRPDAGEPRGLNLDPALGLDVRRDDDDKADIEAATWFGGQIAWLGSHSRSGQGRLRAQRRQFFATTASGDGPGPVNLALAARLSHTDPPERSLIGALTRLPVLADAIQLGQQRDAELRPEGKGLNIEGLAARPNENSLLIGLRNPLTAKDEAILIPFLNPAAVLARGTWPELGDPIPLDLNRRDERGVLIERRGIRSLEYSQAAGAYFIVTGPVDDNSTTGGAAGNERFDVYRWSGQQGEPPVVLQGVRAALRQLGALPEGRGARFQPEAMLLDPTGQRLQLLSDDGGRPLREGGPTCSKAPDRERAFRSVILDLK
jgi:hypothetical protein